MFGSTSPRPARFGIDANPPKQIHCRRSLFCTVLIVGALSLPPTAVAGPGSGVDFDRDVRPILSDNCFQCHGPDEAQRQAGIRLDTQEGAFAEVEAGALIAPGNPDASLLIQRIGSDDPDYRMPPPESNRSLSADQIETLRHWIERGAEWSEHWAFVPPSKPELPKVSNDAWVRNPIDRFVLSKLDAMGLSPSREASREKLIRRVSLDLTGLPPTPEEVRAFVLDSRPNAYERVVDRLLASPHYGERMAWPWLDAARYADTNGYQGDRERTMYPWRDWVVQAFNDNIPYDRFSVWQLAGDLLPEPTEEQRIATGFNRNHMINGEGGRIAEENRVEYIFDQLETVGTVWMGLTMNCARCHDHKYDPITNEEYYQFFAFFNQTPVTGEGGDPKTAPNLALRPTKTEVRLTEIRGAITSLSNALDDRKAELLPKQTDWEMTAVIGLAGDGDFVSLLNTPVAERTKEQIDEIAKRYLQSDEEYRELQARLTALEKERDGIEARTVRVMIMEDMKEQRETFMLARGVYNRPGKAVTADTPAALPAMAEDAPRNRLGLARWLMDPGHPLTARVTVNRFWAEFFGQGLVKSAENFGVQGEQPTHPELLDWLAVTFVESGWDVKALLRQMVTSATYRQDSTVVESVLAADPQNRYFARGPRFRMPSWMIRDQALASSGLLVDKLGGPPVKPYQPDGLWQEFSFGNIKYTRDTGENLYRRSLYTYWRRIVAPPMFFDASSRQTCAVNATRTNTPLHALATLNDPAYVEAGRALAADLLTLPIDDRERIDAAFQRIVARSARVEELELLIDSLERLRKQYAADPEAARAYLAVGEFAATTELDPVEHAAYAGLCLALLNTDEALTKQ